MCGITGILGAFTKKQVTRALCPMLRKIAHRGPDDEGRIVLGLGECGVGLAHSRLAIIDLSPAAHQPMSSHERRYWIVFNGEIYNYRELREELGAGSREQGAVSKQGAKSKAQSAEGSAVTGRRSPVSENAWQSNSDTEVILRAYERWGLGCLEKLRGMFAFAIWDNRDEKLILARDPFGVKPLYYYQTDRVFVFASEVRALLASGLVPRKLSQDGLISYLQFGSVQDPLTMIDGVQALLPGRCLVVKFKNNRLQTESSNYAKPVFEETEKPAASTRSEAVAILRAKLEESVRLHLISDVPLGAFLSGGIDSSAIVALMSRVAGQRAKTFSVVFEEAEFSEGEHAKLVARKFGTEHHEILLSEQSLLDMFPNALEAMDQPTMDGINTYVISKAVKEAGVTVALSGLGGDELFAGYPSFRRAQQMRNMSLVPQALRQPASAVGRSLLNDSARNRKFWDMVDSDCSPYAAYSLSRQLFSPTEIAFLLDSGQRSAVRGQRSEVRKSAVRNPQSEINDLPLALSSSLQAPSSLLPADLINEVSRLELSGYMANTLLRDTDQMSMAHALEVRVPFVDPIVVNYVLGLPGEWKTKDGRPKPLLVDALEDLLPEEIWKRRKMGFTLPFKRWMRAGLKSEISQVLSDKNGLERIGLNGDETRGIWQAFNNKPEQEPWSRTWALYVLKQWCERNGVTAG